MVEQKKRPKKSLKRNALSNVTFFGISASVTFFITPFIIAYLGQRQYGIWALVSSFVGYFGLLRFGIGTGVLKFVSYYRSNRTSIEVSKIVNSGLSLYIAIGLLIPFIGELIAQPLSSFFLSSSELTTLIKIVAVAAAIETPMHIFDASIRAYEGFIVSNILQAVTLIIRSALLITCILFDLGIEAMVYSLVVVSSIKLLITIVAFFLQCPEVKISIKYINLDSLKELSVFGISIISTTIFSMIVNTLPKVIIGRYISIEAVGIFHIAKMLDTYYRRGIRFITTVFLPRFSMLSGQNNIKGIKDLFISSSKIISLISGLIATGLWTVGPGFIRLWVEESSLKVIPLMLIITFSGLVYNSPRLGIELLLALGKQNLHVLMTFMETILVLVFSIFLSQSFGLIGMAYAITIPRFIVYAIISVIFQCKAIGLNPLQFYLKVIFRAWIPVVICTIIGFSLNFDQHITTWNVFIEFVIIVTCMYSILMLLFSLTIEERFSLETLITDRVKKIKKKL